jgi:hypothetical protein
MIAWAEFLLALLCALVVPAAPLYRSPICIATSGPQRGKIVSLKY